MDDGPHTQEFYDATGITNRANVYLKYACPDCHAEILAPRPVELSCPGCDVALVGVDIVPMTDDEKS